MIQKNRAKKGGETAINGEFYKGGSFLPSTRLPKQSPVKKSFSQPKKTLSLIQIENIKNAIAGTEKALEKAIIDSNLAAINGNTDQLNYLKAKLSL